MDVKAFSCAPTASVCSAMSRALRVVVPLNSICSRKWESPFSAGVSYCEPAPIHTPADTERKCSMRSPIIHSPLSSTILSYISTLLSFT